MVICELCGKDMGTSNGCDCTKFKYKGKVYNRLRVGEEFDLYAGDEGKCPDCGATQGFCHHYRCAVETNPVNHEQMLDYDFVEEFIKNVH